MKKKNMIYTFLILISTIFAYGESKISTEFINYLIIGVLLIVLIVLVVLLIFLVNLSRSLFLSEEEKKYREAFNNQTTWEKVFNLNPVIYEEKLLIEHDYDGIRELNNPTPPWFNFLFYGTIVFGVVYLLVFHVFEMGLFQEAEYKQEVAIATKAREEAMKKFANSINESNVKLLTDAKSIEEGLKIYTKNCVACHGTQGQGGVGPNLTDAYWLHGGSIKKVFRTITVGIPQKGMIAWQKQLNPLQIQQVASYVLTLKGTSPPNPKKPEGDLEN